MHNKCSWLSFLWTLFHLIQFPYYDSRYTPKDWGEEVMMEKPSNPTSHSKTSSQNTKYLFLFHHKVSLLSSPVSINTGDLLIKELYETHFIANLPVYFVKSQIYLSQVKSTWPFFLSPLAQYGRSACTINMFRLIVENVHNAMSAYIEIVDKTLPIAFVCT